MKKYNTPELNNHLEKSIFDVLDFESVIHHRDIEKMRMLVHSTVLSLTYRADQIRKDRENEESVTALHLRNVLKPNGKA